METMAILRPEPGLCWGWNRGSPQHSNGLRQRRSLARSPQSFKPSSCPWVMRDGGGAGARFSSFFMSKAVRRPPFLEGGGEGHDAFDAARVRRRVLRKIDFPAIQDANYFAFDGPS